MGRSILVIGGTYFAGRVFSLLAQDEGNQVTVMNRGTYSMKGTGIAELRCDRRDTAALEGLQTQAHYDAVVDFCAYEPGDIRAIFEHLPCRFDRYIYVSTPDVTKPSRNVRNEESQVLELQPQDEVGLYTWKKLGLESELVTAAHGAGTGYTIIRPAFMLPAVVTVGLEHFISLYSPPEASRLIILRPARKLPLLQRQPSTSGRA